ncbi:MAG: thiolase family protein [Candidatus Lustribacter sp.]
MRDKYAIVGTATSDLGRTGKDSLYLLEQAMRRAIDDAGLKVSDIDGIVSRGADDIYTHHQRIGARLGIDVRFSTSLDNGGASQILAVALACMAIDAGLATTVITGYGRNSWTRTHATEGSRTQMELVPDDQLPKEFAPEYGYFGAPGTHALGAQRHMYEFGTKREHFGRVAMAFREHALRNPNAVMKKPLTMDDYLNARMVVEPYGLYDCSLVSDGAGAVIVTSVERAKTLKQPPVVIKGFGTFNNTRGWLVEDHMIRLAAKQSGEQAYKMAGLSAQDVSTAQIYDCFTGMVVAQLEDYGFCKKGEGGPFVASGALELGGALPTNTSGGQLSEAHVEGMLQIVEGVRQLRHQYEPARQVKDAQIALVSGHGGNTVCHSSLLLGRA